MAKLDEILLERLLPLVREVAPIVNDQRVILALACEKITRLL